MIKYMYICILDHTCIGAVHQSTCSIYYEGFRNCFKLMLVCAPPPKKKKIKEMFIRHVSNLLFKYKKTKLKIEGYANHYIREF